MGRSRFDEPALALALHRAAALLRCGCSLVDALQALHDDADAPGQRRLFADLAHRVAAGAPLSQALAQGAARRVVRAELLSEIVARVHAAQADGSLAEAFDDLEASLLQRHRHRVRLSSALVYPACAAVALSLACVFLLVRVVPALGSGPLAAPAAWHARPLLWMGDVLSGNAPLFGVWTDRALLGTVLVLAATSVHAWRSWRRGSGRSGACGAADAFALSRAAACVARLHGAGLPLDQALAIAATGCPSRRLTLALRVARARLMAGASLSDALHGQAAVPTLFARFVGAGERAGALRPALTRAAEHHEQDAMRRLHRTEALAAPAVLCVFGALLLWVVVSVLLPVYEQALARGLT